MAAKTPQTEVAVDGERVSQRATMHRERLDVGPLAQFRDQRRRPSMSVNRKVTLPSGSAEAAMHEKCPPADRGCQPWSVSSTLLGNRLDCDASLQCGGRQRQQRATLGVSATERSLELGRFR
jgi:hypothetical protein